MSKAIWKPTTLLGPIPPVLVSCGTMEHPRHRQLHGAVLSTPTRLWPMSPSVLPAFPILLSRIVGSSSSISHPHRLPMKAVDFCGVRSGKDMDKLSLMGLTASPCQMIRAPLIEECPVNLECKVTQVLPLGSHDMFLGSKPLRPCRRIPDRRCR